MAAHKLTKADIIDSVYQKTGLDRQDVRAVIDLFCGEVKGAMVRQESVELRGFGTFEIRVRKGRLKARNPRTGESVSVSSHGIAAFRPGRELKRSVWNLKGSGESPSEAEP
ncbi:MAG: integration host factor subunit beta [Treponema sp.]|jgi:integration host factor subunit beta|nr:integration host factor subunit beta [Treponema sp.]